jgi:hypothetical protein
VKGKEESSDSARKGRRKSMKKNIGQNKRKGE